MSSSGEDQQRTKQNRQAIDEAVSTMMKSSRKETFGKKKSRFKMRIKKGDFKNAQLLNTLMALKEMYPGVIVNFKVPTRSSPQLNTHTYKYGRKELCLRKKVDGGIL